MKSKLFKSFIFILSGICVLLTIAFSNQSVKDVNTGNVIFIHPDGTGLANWNALRILYYGPDGETNWDKLSILIIRHTELH
jgi:alkaline phosphatase